MSTAASSSLSSSSLPLIPLLYLGPALVAIIPWVHPQGVAGSNTTDRQIGGGVLNSPHTLDRMLEEACLNPETCKEVGGAPCWGYEDWCSEGKRLFLPYCDEPAKPWANSMKDKEELFWRQGDFGYVNDVAKSLMTLCEMKEQVIHY
ncbi:PREDICTED: uncharacterized protein LOC109585580 [Amphimedon queenslandica]|uniref:Uncharacterized protein n=1 Tax=Amphimedon queenslandica TaxID=400682 RepID=A0AAN0JKM8_AMPQE|nr:PREDICTED: uncharacterized protein LOC109585580 [Amphimedon queenslandica]|eukprot:XP_019857263.1 PREDICTED: uncharacterized protein LOC109585580 [Amphimedon queenslandica]